MKKFNSFLAMALCAVAVMAISCDKDSDDASTDINATEAEQDLLEAYTYDVIVARYSQLATDAKALLEAAEAITNATDVDATDYVDEADYQDEDGEWIDEDGYNAAITDYEENKEALAKAAMTSLISDAADAWLAARVSWERTEAYLFGPVDQAGIDPGIDSWPLALTSLQNLISGWYMTGDAINMATLSGDFKGFHAIEYVLFMDGEPKEDSVNKFTSEYEITVDTDDLESYLVSVCDELYRCVLQLEAEWYKDGLSSSKLADFNAYGSRISLLYPSGNYAEIFSQPHLDNAYYTSFNTCLDEALLGAAGIAEEVADVKISDPINAEITSPGTGLLKVESWFSYNSIEDFTNNIRGIKEAYMGKLCIDNEDTFDIDTTPATNSIGALYAESDAVAAASLVSTINDAISAVKAMTAPFRSNLSWSTDNLAAKDAVLALQAALEDASADLLE